jgi:Prokaryotic Cytochrome C oxidase subunit IV
MASLFKTRITAVWVLLVAATAASWEMGHGLFFDDPGKAAIAIIVVALVKVRFVMMEFMELRGAPLAMRLAADAWLAVVGALMIAVYLGAIRLPM